MGLILEHTKQNTYTGDEALQIVDTFRPAVDEHFALDHLKDEFPTFAHYIERLGTGALYLARADDNLAGAFKWRGAAVGATALYEQGVDTMIVPSAGNHARGAVLAAKLLDMQVTVVVPTTAPPAKKEGLRELWNSEKLRIVAEGTSFNDSLDWALNHPKLGTLLHPFDNPNVIAGQGTLADDIVNTANGQPIDHVVMPVGGGGLLAGIAQRLDQLDYTDTQLHAIEPQGSNSLSQSLAAGQPVEALNPHKRYGGSAVHKVGGHTFSLLQRFSERIHVHSISDDEVDSLMSDYTFDRLILEREHTPNLEPTSLAAIAKIGHIATAHPGESVVAVGTGHNASLA